MRPLFFGSRDEPLYGVFHPAHSGHARPDGVVLCYPIGLEYMQTHRAYRQLAEELSRAGIPVLRFDYSGTGDSWGDGEDGSIDRWLEDLDMAVTELRDMARASSVSLVGFRFGATMALLHAARSGDVGTAVLWDPVYRGEAYSRELKESSFRPNGNGAGEGHDRDWIAVNGFRFSTHLLEELDDVNLSGLSGVGLDRLHVISGGDLDDARNLLSRFQEDGAGGSVHELESEGGWSDGQGFSSAVLDRRVVDIVVRVLEGVRP